MAAVKGRASKKGVAVEKWRVVPEGVAVARGRCVRRVGVVVRRAGGMARVELCFGVAATRGVRSLRFAAWRWCIW